MHTRPTLVLDLDGTLIDTAHDLVRTLNFLLGLEGISPLPFDTARRFVGHGARAMLEAGFHASGVRPSETDMDRLFNSFIAYYSDHVADHSVPFPGLLPALDRFTESGWTLAVCTNKLEGLARLLLDKLALSPRFAVIAGQDTFEWRKPDPRALIETIRHAGGDPALAVMVGDSDVDIATAQAAHIPVVAVTFGYSPMPVSAYGPDVIIDHFDALYEAASGQLGKP